MNFNRKTKNKYLLGIFGTKTISLNTKYSLKVKNKYNQITKVLYYNQNMRLKEIVCYNYYKCKKIKNKKIIVWDQNNKIIYFNEKNYYLNRKIKDQLHKHYDQDLNIHKIANFKYTNKGDLLISEIINENKSKNTKKVSSYIYNKKGQLSSNKSGNAFKIITNFINNQLDSIIEYKYDFKGNLVNNHNKLCT
ncbi:hypothetical protein [Mycoplasma sp. P36-A1]|uniref:hypothetical protein n=1 Tax=Mycoplasma sp. P36-A1 TaxID=3252900 RepID=UPI003C2ADFD0